MHMHVTRQREFYVTFFKSLLRIVLAEVILLVLSTCCAVTPYEEIHQICSKSLLDFNTNSLWLLARHQMKQLIASYIVRGCTHYYYYSSRHNNGTLKSLIQTCNVKGPAS